MKKIVIDVDGVILNIHEELERRLKQINDKFRMANVLTYDFNKSFDSMIFSETIGENYKSAFDNAEHLGLFVPRKEIFNVLGDIELFKNCKPFEHVVEIIERIPKDMFEVIIHTYAEKPEIAAFKTIQIHKLLGHIVGITIVTSCGKHKPAIECDYVIEDSIDSFSHFSASLLAKNKSKFYLIDMPFNNEIFNESAFKNLGIKNQYLKKVPNLSTAIQLITGANVPDQPRYIDLFGKFSFIL